MFLGEYTHTIDDKGRVIMPSRFRQELGENFIITCGFEKCLVVYPTHKWEELSEKIRKLPFTDTDVRSFIRLFYSKAVEVSLDRLGRVTIPQNLREFASIEKESVINGVLENIEIWNSRIWGEYSLKAGSNYEKQAQNLSGLF